jgi:hypothetical protein
LDTPLDTTAPSDARHSACPRRGRGPVSALEPDSSVPIRDAGRLLGSWRQRWWDPEWLDGRAACRGLSTPGIVAGGADRCRALDRVLGLAQRFDDLRLAVLEPLDRNGATDGVRGSAAAMIDKGFQFVSCASDARLAASAADAVIGRLRTRSATAPAAHGY